MQLYIRYCPDCGEEYQPHMTQCVECGGALKDKLDGASPEHEEPRDVGPSLPPGDYRKVAHGLSAETVEPLVELFIGAGIPVKVESLAYGLCLSSRFEDRLAVMAILEREGVIPSQPDETTLVVATDGGPCPACGTSITPGTVECPECGLVLSGAGCESCGAALSPTDDACPACGRPLD
jgi:predicted amidophosphoribosyltransferase